MSLTYPSREEAMHYRRELQEAVGAVRKDEEPERDALAWPAGLDRTLLRGVPLPTHTRNCLVRARLMEGDNRLTVAEMLRIPEVGPTTVRNLLVAIDEFLREYIETFEGHPGSAEVAAMRLQREVERLTQAGWTILEERMLKRPPTEYHTLAMRPVVDRLRSPASRSRVAHRAGDAQDRRKQWPTPPILEAKNRLLFASILKKGLPRSRDDHAEATSRRWHRRSGSRARTPYARQE